ncbi:MAG TPA: hypothetical protein VNH64_08145 [Parvularculaceae bacterium]|nr:hypothetical protein [Parvularculaceae bacterium]
MIWRPIETRRVPRDEGAFVDFRFLVADGEDERLHHNHHGSSKYVRKTYITIKMGKKKKIAMPIHAARNELLAWPEVAIAPISTSPAYNEPISMAPTSNKAIEFSDRVCLRVAAAQAMKRLKKQMAHSNRRTTSAADLIEIFW